MLNKLSKKSALQSEFLGVLRDSYEVDELEITFPKGVQIVDALKMDDFAANSVLLIKPRYRSNGELLGYNVLQFGGCKKTDQDSILRTLLRGVFAIQQTVRDYNANGCKVTDISRRYLQVREVYKTNSDGFINKAVYISKVPRKTILGDGVAVYTRPVLKTAGVYFYTQDLDALNRAVLKKDSKTFNNILSEKIKQIKLRIEFADRVSKLFVASAFASDVAKNKAADISDAKKSEAI